MTKWFGSFAPSSTPRANPKCQANKIKATKKKANVYNHFYALYRRCSTDFLVFWSSKRNIRLYSITIQKLPLNSSLSKLRLVMNPVLLGMISLWRSQVAKQGSQLVHQRPRCPMTAIRPTWWRVTAEVKGYSYIKKTSCFGWFEDREFPLLLRENQFFGEGVQHIQAFVGGGDLVKTLSRWPCTHLDLKVDPPRPGVQVKHLWYARTSNEHSYHPRLVVPCLHHFAQDHGTLHMRRHSCGNARILRYLGVKCQKKYVVLPYTARMLPRSVKPDGSFSGYTFIYIYIN